MIGILLSLLGSSLQQLRSEQTQNGVAPVDMELGSDVEISPGDKDNGRDDASADSGDNSDSQTGEYQDSVKDLLASEYKCVCIYWQ